MLIEPGDVTVARKEVFGDYTSGITGPTPEDYRIADVLNRRMDARVQQFLPPETPVTIVQSADPADRPAIRYEIVSLYSGRRHIRKVSRVWIGTRCFTFLDRLPKKLAIANAFRQMELHPNE